MRAGELDLYIERGCDWERIFTLYKQTGIPIDLTLAKVEMQIRESAQGNIVCIPTIEVIEGKNGKVRIYIDNKQTSKLPAYGNNYGQTTRYVYDMFVKFRYRRERILNGFVHISPEVTK